MLSIKINLINLKNFGKKSELEKLEDIEILRFFELGITCKNDSFI